MTDNCGVQGTRAYIGAPAGTVFQGNSSPVCENVHGGHASWSHATTTAHSDDITPEWGRNPWPGGSPKVRQHVFRCTYTYYVLLHLHDKPVQHIVNNNNNNYNIILIYYSKLFNDIIYLLYINLYPILIFKNKSFQNFIPCFFLWATAFYAYKYWTSMFYDCRILDRIISYPMYVRILYFVME